MKNKKLWLLTSLIFLIIIIDQWTKIYVAHHFFVGESVKVIDGFFNLTYVRNSGAAFGFGGAFANWIRYTIFRALPVGACIWLAVLLYKSYKKDTLLSCAYALILGGAVGNLIDRFRLDYVIDFFDFYYERNHFATFNIADSAITVAAGLLIIDYFIQLKKNKNKELQA